MPARILLFGHDGQIGWELERALAPLGAIVAPEPEDADFAEPDALRRAVREAAPDIVVNAAGYTDVERAEDEPSVAHAINGVAPGILAEEAAKLGARFVHYSTDYVFDGASARPYREDDPPGPLNAYGESKLAGERAVRDAGGAWLILRTSWVYAARGRNFLRTVLDLARTRPELTIVADQRGAPTWARAIAEATAKILAQESAMGLYHMTAAGETSWHGFASRIVQSLRARDPEFPAPPVRAVATGDYPAKARRPAYSALDNSRLREDFGITLPDWRDQLDSCLDDLAKK